MRRRNCRMSVPLSRIRPRVGGITPGAEPRDVYVVRSHLTEGGQPEIFKINLDDIVVKKDYKTNIRVLPFDQIYVGETRKSRVERNIPEWLRPVLNAFFENGSDGGAEKSASGK